MDLQAREWLQEKIDKQKAMCADFNGDLTDRQERLSRCEARKQELLSRDLRAFSTDALNEEWLFTTQSDIDKLNSRLDATRAEISTLTAKIEECNSLVELWSQELSEEAT